MYISTELFAVIEGIDFNFEIVFVKIKVICDIFNREIKFEKRKVMQMRFFRFFILVLFVNISYPVFSQEMPSRAASIATKIDSLRKGGVILREEPQKPEITLTREQAVKFLQQKSDPRYWNDARNPLRVALNQLVYESSHPPYDTARLFLEKFPFDSLYIPWDKFYIREPLRLKIPAAPEPRIAVLVDSVASDTTAVKRINDTLITELPDDVLPEEFSITRLIDTTLMVVIDTLDQVRSSSSFFPFRYLDYPYQTDSIKTAVNLLLNYLEERDSSIVYFTGIGNTITPVWINTKSGDIMRFWLKNDLSDSVTVWIGNTDRNTVGLYLEQGVSFKRPVMQGNYSDAKIDLKKIDNSKLLNVQKIVTKPQYWKYRSEASFVFSQSALSNWVKGGENSVATALDITGYADYNNKALKLSSNNFARLKLGFLKSGDNDIRKNLDLIETNSKLNHKAFGKFDFSAIMLFKTQVAPGFTYKKDKNGTEIKIPASKMLNPAILTVGFGLDYKPNKTTSINFSPLSYKGTFVTDPAYWNQTFDSTKIDQTKYGILKDKKAKNEPGASFMITNEYKPLKNITVTNRLQLFTNYINNPLNIDVDWEMIAVINLNWFTDVRFNSHLIFDDDTKTVDKKGNDPLKKTARIQFKEMFGLSLVFRF